MRAWCGSTQLLAIRSAATPTPTRHACSGRPCARSCSNLDQHCASKHRRTCGRAGRGEPMIGSRSWEFGRRRFLLHMTAAAAGAVIAGRHGLAAAEPPPETTRVRLAHAPFICLAPQYLAEEFLRSEGFTDWEYLP